MSSMFTWKSIFLVRIVGYSRDFALKKSHDQGMIGNRVKESLSSFN
ncbi:hypothetical protein [Pseudobacteroides cellulosolvens]|nr:hypothetical protein [Pseudobacteroides cellulosolvens]